MQLALPMKPEMMALDPKAIEMRTSMTSALMFCAELGGVEPKQLVPGVVKDTESWSRIRSGNQFFPHDRLCAFMDICQNEAPLFWLAHRRGYELVPLESELERQLRIEREARARTEAENRLLRNLLQGKAA